VREIIVFVGEGGREGGRGVLEDRVSFLVLEDRVSLIFSQIRLNLETEGFKPFCWKEGGGGGGEGGGEWLAEREEGGREERRERQGEEGEKECTRTRVAAFTRV